MLLLVDFVGVGTVTVLGLIFDLLEHNWVPRENFIHQEIS